MKEDYFPANWQVKTREMKTDCFLVSWQVSWQVSWPVKCPEQTLAMNPVCCLMIKQNVDVEECLAFGQQSSHNSRQGCSTADLQSEKTAPPYVLRALETSRYGICSFFLLEGRDGHEAHQWVRQRVLLKGLQKENHSEVPMEPP